jgi:hypothetical protein
LITDELGLAPDAARRAHARRDRGTDRSQLLPEQRRGLTLLPDGYEPSVGSGREVQAVHLAEAAARVIIGLELGDRLVIAPRAARAGRAVPGANRARRAAFGPGRGEAAVGAGGQGDA